MTSSEVSPPWPSDTEEEPVGFFYQHTGFQLTDPQSYSLWVNTVIAQENAALHRVHFIFCTDEYLHSLNVDYLGHDTFTDIITFPYQQPPEIEGDIFISVDRVRENAGKLGLQVSEEMDRVMAHGLLHLCGYYDKSPEEKQKMTFKEDQALLLRRSL